MARALGVSNGYANGTPSQFTGTLFMLCVVAAVLSTVFFACSHRSKSKKSNDRKGEQKSEVSYSRTGRSGGGGYTSYEEHAEVGVGNGFAAGTIAGLAAVNATIDSYAANNCDNSGKDCNSANGIHSGNGGGGGGESGVGGGYSGGSGGNNSEGGGKRTDIECGVSGSHDSGNSGGNTNGGDVGSGVGSSGNHNSSSGGHYNGGSSNNDSGGDSHYSGDGHYSGGGDHYNGGDSHYSSSYDSGGGHYSGGGGYDGGGGGW